jgi:radical SAM protein with 4Fe4S-binding SPASM domain
MDGRLIALAEDVILRDERQYLESHACFLRLPRTGDTIYLSPSAFELVVHLSKASTRDEAWNYYQRRCAVNGDKPDQAEFGSFVTDLLERGVLEPTATRQVRMRPLSNLGLKPSPTAIIKPMTFPTRVSLVLTIRCNLACRHCLRSSSPLLEGIGELDTQEVVHLMDELDSNGVTSLQLSGGEVTLRKDILTITEHIKRLRTHVQFLTNGFVLRPKLLDLLGDVQQTKGKGFFVHLSLDGSTPETNDWLRGKRAFACTIRAMKQLREAGVTVVAETCLTPKNPGELCRIAEICASHGVASLSFHPISFTGRAGCNPVFLPMRVVNSMASQLDELAKEYRQTMNIEFGYQFSPSPREAGSEGAFPLPPNTTGAGMFHMAIGVDGTVYPCVESLGTPKLIMGNVRTQSTAEIWGSPRWDIFRGGWTLDELEGCRGCIFDRRCSTQACRCYAVATGLDFYSPFKDCYENADVLWRAKKA